MTRDNDLNGLEHYERFLDAQRIGLTVQEQDLFHKALRRSVRPVITSKEPAAPMTRGQDHRTCEWCEGEDHHWMYAGNEDEKGSPLMNCKHCEATRPTTNDDGEEKADGI